MEKGGSSEIEVCKATDVNVRAVGWSTWTCDELQARGLRNTETTPRTICFDISGFCSTWERFGYELKLNDKKESSDLLRLRSLWGICSIRRYNTCIFNFKRWPIETNLQTEQISCLLYGSFRKELLEVQSIISQYNICSLLLARIVVLDLLSWTKCFDNMYTVCLQAALCWI